MGIKESGHLACQVVGTAYVSTEHGNDMLTQRVDTYYGWVFVLVLDVWRNGAHADTHSADEDKAVIFSPLPAYVSTLNPLCTKFTLESVGDILSSLTNLYNRYFLHFSIFIG
jgi:hypothetical protein